MLVSVLAASILLVLLIGAVPPRRGFVVELGAGLGYLGLALLAFQLGLGARPRRLVDAVGLDAVLLFHRQLGLWASVFVAAHVGLLAAAKPGYVSFLLDAHANAPRAIALGGALLALPLLVFVPRQLTRLRVPYEAWRVGHGLLAVFVVGVALWHVLTLGRSSATPVERAAVIALIGAPLAALVAWRVLRPLAALRRPWRVVEVRNECGRVWTLVLEAIGHGGLSFLPGQFVWLTLGRSPFSPRQHPFTIASSATRPRRLELTIKELGDFTHTVGQTTIGTRAYLAGPYGALVLDPRERRPLVCIAGGIGITPMMSMIRTLRDRGDRRAVLLVYGSGSIDTTVFGPELDDLAREMDLHAVHVLERPPAGWTGERGVVRAEILERHLTDAYAAADVFVCGPESMMGVVEQALRAGGVASRRIRTEHFAIVGTRAPGRSSILERHVRWVTGGLALMLVAAAFLVAMVRARG